MQYKAWIQRQFAFADEAIQITLDDIEDLDTFKQRVFEALTVSDYRAHEQLQKLFEDSDLVKQLNYNELQSARSLATKLYPKEHLSNNLDLGKVVFEFSKLLPGGETLRLFAHDFETYDDIAKSVKAVWEIIDKRLQRTNKRELDTASYFKSLSFTYQTKLGKILELLYGKAFKEAVVEYLEQVKESEAANAN